MIYKIGILMIFVISSIEDIRKKEIFLWEVLVCALLSVASELMAFLNGSFDILDVLLSLLPGAAMLILAFITREGIGFGDGLIILAAGPALGLYGLLTTFVTAVFLSGLFSAIMLVLKKANRKTKIAFAPFLAVGCAMATAVGYGFGG